MVMRARTYIHVDSQLNPLEICNQPFNFKCVKPLLLYTNNSSTPSPQNLFDTNNQSSHFIKNMDMEILHTKQEIMLQEVTNNLTKSQPGPPHDAIFLVLSRLPLFELLSMSQVCKSLKDAVDDDILLWLHIFIDKPLNSRVSDRTLVEITSKAHGRLKSLALIDCLQITDAGLQAVIANNPLINKVYILVYIGTLKYFSMH